MVFIIVLLFTKFVSRSLLLVRYSLRELSCDPRLQVTSVGRYMASHLPLIPWSGTRPGQNDSHFVRRLSTDPRHSRGNAVRQTDFF